MSLIGNLTETQVSDLFFQAYDDAIPQQLVSRLSIIEDSVLVSDAKFGFASQSPKPVKRKRGEPLLVTRVNGNAVEIAQERYEGALAIDIDDLDDDSDGMGTGTLQRRMNELTEPLANLRYTLMIDQMLDNPTAYDGTALIANTRTNAVNLLTASEVPTLNVATATAPTPEEFTTAVVDIIGKMHGFTDEQRHAVNRSARQFTVFVPTNMWGSAITAVSANNLTSGQTAVLNELNNGTGYSIDIQADPLLTSTSQIFVVRHASAGRGAFIATQRKAPTVTYLGVDSDHCVKHNEVLTKVSWRGGAGPGEPRYIARGTFS